MKSKIVNKHKATKIWSSFKSDAAKKMFNDVMDKSLKLQGSISHPDMVEMPHEQWQTICWNMACFAAWSVDNQVVKVVK